MPSWYSVDKDFYSAHPVRGARRGREKGENILLMANKGKSLILLVLTVLLLVVISSRVAPDAARDTERGPTAVDDPPVVTSSPIAEETPEPTPTPELRIRDRLPGISTGDWNLKLVNETYVLSNSFAPDVTAVRDNQYFDTRAADALEAMLSAAEEAGYTVVISAAYRPYSTQAYLFFGKASQIAWGGTVEYAEAETLARKIVAYPGTSEHQLGLAVDILDSSSTKLDVESTEGLPVLEWLTEHCAEYGFILRYPKDKQDITGWYEPWHFRYVGETCAKFMMDEGLTLEEFIEEF